MRAVRVCTFVMAGVAVAVSGRVVAQQPQQPLFRSSTQTVPVYATVLDAVDSRLVTGLTRENFDVLDNGRSPCSTTASNPSA